jgi:hypothetical protein
VRVTDHDQVLWTRLIKLGLYRIVQGKILRGTLNSAFENSWLFVVPAVSNHCSAEAGDLLGWGIFRLHVEARPGLLTLIGTNENYPLPFPNVARGQPGIR